MDRSSNPEKCSCEEGEEKNLKEVETVPESLPPSPKRSKLSLSSLSSNLRKGLKRTKKQSASNSAISFSTIKKSSKWVMKLNCSKKIPKEPENQSCCQCTCYNKVEENATEIIDTVSSNRGEEEEESDVCNNGSSNSSSSNSSSFDAANDNKQEDTTAASNADEEVYAGVESTTPQLSGVEQIVHLLNRDIYGPTRGILPPPIIDMHWLHTFHEDCDETARLQRAREIEQGVEIRPPRRVQLVCSDVEGDGRQTPRRLQLVCPPDLTMDSLCALFQTHVTLRSCPLDSFTGCHTQVDFIHCLVPDLLDVTNCSFYWGKMDRYEAERLLDGKPEGTFLLRDSAQEEYLFSVSFRKYGRSLHARIEQWNHKFSFDSHDPGVYTSSTVCGLIKHYKDPSTCMFFEPMLTWPLHRNFVFPLQHLCRASIVNKIGYDDVNQLQLPKCLKVYLKEYHYRQKVRVERFDEDEEWIDLRNVQT